MMSKNQKLFRYKSVRNLFHVYSTGLNLIFLLIKSTHQSVKCRSAASCSVCIAICKCCITASAWRTTWRVSGDHPRSMHGQACVTTRLRWRCRLCVHGWPAGRTLAGVEVIDRSSCTGGGFACIVFISGINRSGRIDDGNIIAKKKEFNFPANNPKLGRSGQSRNIDYNNKLINKLSR